MLMPSLIGFAQTAEVPVFGEAQRIVERLLYPEQFDVADWNGDGQVDVLVAANGNNSLGLFEADSTGEFAWVELLPEGTMADDWNDLEVVDWNGDGLVDIVACEEGGLVWLERLTDGSLAPSVTLRAGEDPFRMDITDVNGDGIWDLTYADSGTQEAVCMLGTGDGAVADPVVQNLNGAAVVAFADWDHDGATDWIFGSYSWGQLYVAAGDGTGEFGDPELAADFGKLSAIGVLHGANGEPDSIFLGVDDTYVLQWHPDGASPDTLGLLAKAQRFDFGDLNADGFVDIAVAAQITGACGVIYALPEGGFDPDIVELEMHQAMDVAIAEINGQPSLFTNARSRGQVGYWGVEPGGGTWTYAPLIEGIQYVRNLAAGDVNGDGRDDALIMVQGTNLYNGGPEYLYVALAEPDGGFDVTYTPTGTYFGYEVQLGDYDGDGDLDAVVSDYNGDRVVGLRNDATGQFHLADTLIASINGCDDIALVDLDADGDLDVVAGAWQGSDVLIALNDGTGGFDIPIELSNTGSRCEAVVVGDFNGDGPMDVAACFENSGDVRVWLRNADEAVVVFSEPQMLDLPSAQDLQTADADGDGDLDLLGVGYNENDVVVFTNEGGVFQPGSLLGFQGVNGALMLTAADPDGEGTADVIVSEYGGARFRLFHGASSAVVDLDQGSGPQNAVFGDFDGDGDQDIAMAYYSTGEIRWVELVEGMQPPVCYATEELLAFLAHFGCSGFDSEESECADHDLDNDGTVTVFDFLTLLEWLHVSCDN